MESKSVSKSILKPANIMPIYRQIITVKFWYPERIALLILHINIASFIYTD